MQLRIPLQQVAGCAQDLRARTVEPWWIVDPLRGMHLQQRVRPACGALPAGSHLRPQPHAEVGVLRIAEAVQVATDGVEQISRRREAAGEEQSVDRPESGPQIGGLGPLAAPVRVAQGRCAGHQHRAGSELGRHRLDPSAEEDVVAVQEGQPLRRHGTSPPVACRAHTLVRGDDHLHTIVAMRPEQVDRRIGRAVVDDDHETRWTWLAQHAVHRRHDGVGAIERRNHHRDHRAVLGSLHLAPSLRRVSRRAG